MHSWSNWLVADCLSERGGSDRTQGIPGETAKCFDLVLGTLLTPSPYPSRCQGPIFLSMCLWLLVWVTQAIEIGRRWLSLSGGLNGSVQRSNEHQSRLSFGGFRPRLLRSEPWLCCHEALGQQIWSSFSVVFYSCPWDLSSCHLTSHEIIFCTEWHGGTKGPIVPNLYHLLPALRLVKHK